MRCSKVGILVIFGICTLPFGRCSYVKKAVDMLIGSWAGLHPWRAHFNPGIEDAMPGDLKSNSSSSHDGIGIQIFDNVVHSIEGFALKGYETASKGLDFLDRVDGHHELYKAILRGLINTTDARSGLSNANEALRRSTEQIRTFICFGQQLFSKMAQIVNAAYQIAIGSVNSLLTGDFHDVVKYGEDLMRLLTNTGVGPVDKTSGTFLTNWFGRLSSGGEDGSTVLNAGIRTKYGSPLFGYYVDEQIERVLKSVLSMLIEATKVYRPILQGATDFIILVLTFLRSVMNSLSVATFNGLLSTGTVLRTSTQPVAYGATRAAGLAKRLFQTISEKLGGGMQRVANGITTIGNGTSRTVMSSGKAIFEGITYNSSSFMSGPSETRSSMTTNAEGNDIGIAARKLNYESKFRKSKNIGLNSERVKKGSTKSPGSVDPRLNNSTSPKLSPSISPDNAQKALKMGMSISTDSPSPALSTIEVIGDLIMEGVGTVGGNVVGGVRAASIAVVSGLSFVTSGLLKGAEVLVNSAAQGGGIISHAIGKVGHTIVEDVGTTAASGIGKGVEILGSTVSKGAGLVTHAMGTVHETVVEDLAKPVASAIGRGAGFVGNTFAKGVNITGQAIGNVGQTVDKGVSITGNAIGSGLSTLYNGVGAIHRGVGNGLSFVGNGLIHAFRTPQT